MLTLKTVSDVVIGILRAMPETRDSDKKLYVEVVRKIKPSALYEPFYIAFMDDKLPSTETVRRTRQKAQEQFPELAATPQVEGMREVMEQNFFEFVTRR